MKDIRQSIKYGLYMEKIGWQIDEYEVLGIKYLIYIKKIPFLPFSIIKVQRSDQINFDQLDQLAKSQRAVLVSVEPQTEELVPQLLQHGFRMNKGAMIPSKTRQIDLSPSEQAIFQSFNRTRKYKIGKAARNNFEVKINGKISDFVDLWTKNALKRGFWVPIKDQIKAMYETFGENSYLILAYQEEELIAGILLIIEGKTAHYFYAASSTVGRNLCAPSLLTWEAMKLAKKKGCTIFDFEGIYDERFPQKAWQGFSYFKESFGGKVVTYPGRFLKTQGLLSRLLFF